MKTLTPYNSYAENELLYLLSQDDAEAFTELYDRFWKKLFALAYNRIKEKEAAEDIVHDVFTSLWMNRKKSEIKTIENYLASATKYMVLNKIKKIERERAFKNEHKAPVVELFTENSIHYKRILEIVKTEVEKLPEKCRLIFKYSRNDGLPVNDIARKMNISPKTVENQIGKALKHLRVATKNFLHSFFTL